MFTSGNTHAWGASTALLPLLLTLLACTLLLVLLLLLLLPWLLLVLARSQTLHIV
jgi:hypothetical protein